MDSITPRDSSLPRVRRPKHMHSSRTIIIGALCICLLTHTMLYGFILPVLPTALVTRFSIPNKDVSRWIGILLTVEALATLLFSSGIGYVIKFMHSRRLTLLIGILLLGIAMVIIAVSKLISVLVVGRIVQGISSAIIQVVSVTIILDCSPEDSVGQSMGYAGAAMNLGFLTGPLLGGVVYQFLNWNGLFGVVGGFLVLNLAVPILILPLERQPQDNPASQSSQTNSTPQASTQAIKSFSLLDLLREPAMRVGLWGVIVSGIFISAIDTVLPVFVQEQFDWNSLGQGLIFLPVSLPALLEPIYGWLADRYGARIVGIVSFLALVPITVCLRLVKSNSIGTKVLLCALLTGIGVFLDSTEPAGYVLMDDVLKDMESKSGGRYDWKLVVARSFGVQNAAHYFGITIGPVIINSLPDSDRIGAVGLLLGCLSAVTFLLWVWGVKNPEKEEPELEDGVELAPRGVQLGNSIPAVSSQN
ncbi:uncharacterized protein EAE98_011844 [Botrytis deweyae]|uniref:Major facilitator superfamily (MFS) profile domain-containing protein n=1 Tax=Botrytis deweyae TaxID=2478750 RepID=A0ABQ7I4Z0_9HELO|nr:uncharacterized protein EAE98_011844 [Botrytis deweyae]KAF7911901.1 hypothetical protein EAE98_011844 [Botrytis deweyae]